MGFQGCYAVDAPELCGYVKDSHDYNELFKSLYDEAATLHRLRHPNIICLHGLCVDTDGTRPKYLVVERSICTLSTWLSKTDSAVKLEEIDKIGTDLLRGLDYIHSQTDGLTGHRNLKPDSVLLFSDKGNVMWKLADVDGAKFAYVRGGGSATRAGVLYAAPELCKGQASTKADMFSFGVLMAEVVMTCLRTAEDASSDLYPVTRRLAMVDAAISKLEGSSKFASVLLGCVEVDPAKRLSAKEALIAVGVSDHV